MSYQVLARKYRPKSFETLVGQEHVVRALTHALEQQRLHHAYLFTGTRGVGKTTLSRILAKSFNCVTGITAHPCGVCDACTAIDAGRFVDYIEMDAASNRGVDEMAQLLEQAVYAPSNARFKVYMIDEVHMLTNHAFNAMLKTLEEPPEHIKFILATTDPQKIPVTVLSRCLQFNLKQMPPGHIVSHLDNILGQEGIAFETPALRLLAAGAHGSMRDALSLTDQAIAYAAGTVTLDAVQNMLGALDQSYLIRILDALANKDGADMLAVADDMAARSLSYNAALQDLGGLLHRVALAQTVPDALAEDLPERSEIVRLAGLFDAEEIQLYYQIVVHGRNELGLAPDEYAGFTMTLLRMLAFRPGMGAAETAPPNSAPTSARPAAAAARPAPQQAAAPATPVARLSAAPQVAVSSAPATPIAPTAPVARPAAAMSPARLALEAARNGMKAAMNGGARAANAAAAASVSAPAAAELTPIAAAPVAQPVAPKPESPPPAASGRNEVPPADAPPPWMGDESSTEPPPYDFPDGAEARGGAGNVDANVAPKPAAVAPPPARLTAPTTPFKAEPVPLLNWDGDWPALAASLPVRGVAQQLALQSELVRCDVSQGNPVFCLQVAVETLLSANGSVEKLTAALSERFGRDVRIESTLGAVEHTANAASLAEKEARQKRTEELLQNDPFVQKLMREFGASIMPGSIRPA
jgi:DNA polymerase-3 subunit gamma/tau